MISTCRKKLEFHVHVMEVPQHESTRVSNIFHSHFAREGFPHVSVDPNVFWILIRLGS